MFRKAKREFSLLARGEQGAILLLAVLVLMFLGGRSHLRSLPPPVPPGTDEFLQELSLYQEFLHVASEPERLLPPQQVRRSPRIPDTVYINRTDSAGLLPLPGIGPVLAGRIIRYRDLLGGYVRIEQLGEVYGLPQETLERIRSVVCVEPGLAGRLDPDSMTFRELLRHPYLSYEDVSSLFRFRDVKGRFPTLAEIRENNLWSDSIIDRAGLYFKGGEERLVER
ncbi:MAG: helix-hairpin-helix domain-containing protein [Bacteroidales bacterium]